MNTYELWLLRKLVHKMLQYRCGQKLMDILWEESKSIFHEDNIYDRFEYFAEKLRLAKSTELRDLQRRL